MSFPTSSRPAFALAAVSRSVVYGGLALFVAALYVAIVSVASTLTGPRGQTNLVVSVAAVAVVALALQPLRERLQRLANRLVYGKQATPYEVLADLSRRLASAIVTDEVLPRTAEAAARSVGARTAYATLILPDGQEQRGAWPPGSIADGHEIEVSVDDRGEEIGTILVGMTAGEASGRAALLSDVAVQAAPAFRNMQLTAGLQMRLHQVSVRAKEIQASRQRLVEAEEAARVRFQQEIKRGPEHQLQLTLDGLGPADALLMNDPNAAARRFEELAAGVSQALDDLRELARAVFPPLLADHGLVPALKDQIRKLDLAATVEVDKSLATRRFDPQLETALYFCGAAALRDASDLSPGEPVAVNLDISGDWLRLTLPRPTAATRKEIQDRVDSLGGRIDEGGAASLVLAVPMKTLEIS